MVKIYIVMGQTGEYSDRHEWTVKAFKDENKAKLLVEMAGAKAREIFQAREALGDAAWELYQSLLDTNELDSNMSMDYTGTMYFYYTVELEE